MNLKLFGYSISLNLLILIGILYLIMVVNALSCSCNIEGFNFDKMKSIKKVVSDATSSVNASASAADQASAKTQMSALQKIYATASDAQKPDILNQMVQLQTASIAKGYSLN